MSATSFETILVTGTSRGIGLETVKQLLINPKRIVYATARNTSQATKLIQLQSQFNDRLFIEKLDVSSEESIKNLVNKLKHVKFNLQSIMQQLPKKTIESPEPQKNLS